jgi:hypothetical protein
MARPGIETPPTPKHKIRTGESRAKEARELRKQKRPQPTVDAEGNLAPKQRGEPVKILSPEERGGKKSKAEKKASKPKRASVAKTGVSDSLPKATKEPTKDSFDDEVASKATDKLPEKKDD